MAQAIQKANLLGQVNHNFAIDVRPKDPLWFVGQVIEVGGTVFFTTCTCMCFNIAKCSLWAIQGMHPISLDSPIPELGSSDNRGPAPGWLRHSLRLLFPAAAHAMDGRAAALLRLEGAGLPRVTWGQLRCPIVGTAAYVRAPLRLSPVPPAPASLLSTTHPPPG